MIWILLGIVVLVNTLSPSGEDPVLGLIIGLTLLYIIPDILGTKQYKQIQ